MNLRWKIAQTMEQWWWHWYFSTKTPPKYLAWKKKYWEKFLETAQFQPQPGDPVLEIGSGPAGVFMLLPGNPVTAIEPLLRTYERMPSFFNPAWYPYTRFLDLPFEKYEENQRFPCIFCLNVINHVADIELCCKKLKRHLAPGGRLFLTVDAHNHRGLKKVFQWLPGDILHPHQFSLQEYEALLEKHDLPLRRVQWLKSDFIFNYYLIVAGGK
jgi:2-polyprenyl-6-hydroxyphenyl methylase/3-demethylubiquinone-9 3-methyltransferase